MSSSHKNKPTTTPLALSHGQKAIPPKDIKDKKAPAPTEEDTLTRVVRVVNDETNYVYTEVVIKLDADAKNNSFGAIRKKISKALQIKFHLDVPVADVESLKYRASGETTEDVKAIQDEKTLIPTDIKAGSPEPLLTVRTSAKTQQALLKSLLADLPVDKWTPEIVSALFRELPNTWEDQASRQQIQALCEAIAKKIEQVQKQVAEALFAKRDDLTFTTQHIDQLRSQLMNGEKLMGEVKAFKADEKALSPDSFLNTVLSKINPNIKALFFNHIHKKINPGQKISFVDTDSDQRFCEVMIEPDPDPVKNTYGLWRSRIIQAVKDKYGLALKEDDFEYMKFRPLGSLNQQVPTLECEKDQVGYVELSSRLGVATVRLKPAALLRMSRAVSDTLPLERWSPEVVANCMTEMMKEWKPNPSRPHPYQPDKIQNSLFILAAFIRGYQKRIYKMKMQKMKNGDPNFEDNNYYQDIFFNGAKLQRLIQFVQQPLQQRDANKFKLLLADLFKNDFLNSTGITPEMLQVIFIELGHHIEERQNAFAMVMKSNSAADVKRDALPQLLLAAPQAIFSQPVMDTKQRLISRNKSDFLALEDKSPYQLHVTDLPSIIAYYGDKYGIRIVINGSSPCVSQTPEIKQMDRTLAELNDATKKYLFYLRKHWQKPGEKSYADYDFFQISGVVGHGRFTAEYNELYKVMTDVLDTDGNLKESISESQLLELTRRLKLCSCIDKLDASIRQYSYKILEERAAHILTSENCRMEANHLRSELKGDEHIGYIYTNRSLTTGRHFEVLLINEKQLIKPVHWETDLRTVIDMPMRFKLHSVANTVAYTSYATTSDKRARFTPQQDTWSCGSLGFDTLMVQLEDNAYQTINNSVAFDIFAEATCASTEMCFLPSPHALRNTQISFYNLALEATARNELGEIDVKEKETTFITLKQRLQDSINFATARIQQMVDSKAEEKDITPIRKVLAENKADLLRWEDFSKRWLDGYKIMDAKRKRMQIGKINHGLAYRTRKFEMIATIPITENERQSELAVIEREFKKIVDADYKQFRGTIHPQNKARLEKLSNRYIHIVIAIGFKKNEAEKIELYRRAVEALPIKFQMDNDRNYLADHTQLRRMVGKLPVNAQPGRDAKA